MNQKRKAELQRKLSMTSVPRPPSGLLERIKADIPQELPTIDRQRGRFTRSTSFMMRVAASLILVVGAVYVTVRLIPRNEKTAYLSPPTIERKAAAPQAEVRIDLAEATKPATPPAPATATLPSHQDAVQRAALEPAKKQKEEQPRDEQTTDIAFAPEKDVAGRVAGSIAENRPVEEAPAAPSAAAVPAPPPSAVAQSASVERQAEANEGAKLSDHAEGAPPARTMAKTARGNLAAQPGAVFGLSVDPAAFDRVRRMIEEGRQPQPGTIDVAAVVNYLAGTARTKSDVDLEVEASRAPIDLPMVLIRFTVETAHTEFGTTPTPPVVATDAKLTINLNPNAVTSHHLIGAESLKAQSALLRNVSVTGVVDVQLNPGIQPGTRIATLQLRYRSAADQKMKTIERRIYAAQVNRNWESATLRHRLATLGAIWSESVNGGAETGEMAQRAERLATEAPEDARARALAAAASAFSRLRSSGPTGSGR